MGDPGHALQAIESSWGGRATVCVKEYSQDDLSQILRDKKGPWIGQTNWYYSVAAVKIPKPSRGRYKRPSEKDFVEQEWVPFDIDWVDLGIWDQWALVDVVDRVLPHDGERHFVWSGHGLHVLLRVEPFIKTDVFQKTAAAYRAYGQTIFMALEAAGMSCDKVDPVIWDPARMLRLPGTINQKLDSKTGQPKLDENGVPYPPVICEWLTCRGAGPSFDLWRTLTKYEVPFITERQPSEEAAKTKILDKIIELARSRGVGVLEFPRYYRIICPFHKETDPSFVLYKDGGGWGLDQHPVAGEPGLLVSPYFIWLAYVHPDKEAKEPALDDPLYLEYREFIGIPADMESAQRLIFRWAMEKLEPLYRTEDGFFSGKLGREVTVTGRYKWYTRDIASVLHERSIEAETKKGGRVELPAVQQIFMQYAPAAFFDIMAALKPLEDIEEFSDDTRKSLLMMLRAAFNHPIPISIDGQYRTDTLLSLMKTAPWNSARWQEAGQYDAVYRHSEGKWEFAFLPVLLQRLSPTVGWFRQHTDMRKVGQMFIKAGLCTRHVVRFRGCQANMLLLSQEAMDFIDSGQELTPGEAEASNRIADLFDDTTFGGR